MNAGFFKIELIKRKKLIFVRSTDSFKLVAQFTVDLFGRNHDLGSGRVKITHHFVSDLVPAGRVIYIGSYDITMEESLINLLKLSARG